ncbi:hypothetical protein [Mesorhizobium sp. WSM2239]|uniref:Capsular biosynthesis protein n=2 Tax=unclassified Mesorhizobium TaxID=325217 RepID=A0AAU8DHP7_9HYPH
MRAIVRKIVPYNVRQALWRVRNNRPLFDGKPVLPRQEEVPVDYKLPVKATKPDIEVVNRPKAFANLRRTLSLKQVDEATVKGVSELASDTLVTWATLEYRRGNLRHAVELAAMIPRNADINPHLLQACWDSLRDIGRYDLAFKGFATKAAYIGENASLRARRGHTLFAGKGYELFSNYIERYGQVDPKGYVVLFDLNHRITSGLMVPISVELLRQGYDVCSVIPSTMPLSRRPELQGISGAIRTNGSSLSDEPWSSDELHNQWTIDWENEIVSCSGINYYTFFAERISKQQGVYRGKLDTTQAVSLFHSMLRRSDLALVICERLVTLASKTGKPIRLVTMDTHFAPWGVVRRWCEHIGKRHNIHLVGLSVAYENYFSNLSTLEARTISVEDMTARPDVRHPLLAGRYRLDQFIASDPEATTRREMVLEWINLNRSGTSGTDDLERQTVLGAIAAAKAEGRKVFCVFGKVLIDFAAPDDRGNVFRDFPSWAKGLVNLAEESNSLLIIKPHPHELRSEIVQGGSQKLRDLLPESLPNNVIFLGHSSFNSSELADYVDACFLWNGTAYAEYQVLGCPAFAESEWAEKDYPIDAPLLRKLDDYKSLFNGTFPLAIPANTVGRATAYMQFMKSEFVTIPFGYVRRAATNKPIGPNMFYENQLLDLEQNGDPNVTKAASRFFEFDLATTPVVNLPTRSLNLERPRDAKRKARRTRSAAAAS